MTSRTKDQTMPRKRRTHTGAFFTPQPVAELAHKYVEYVLGPDWRERHLVWDPCCGTGNLTREWQFADLVLSTLEDDDVQTVLEEGINPGATICQMDFLNDTVPPEIDAQLRRARDAGKGIVFLMNPPFVDAGAGVGNKGAKARGTTKSAVNVRMPKGVGRRNKNIQFLFACLFVSEDYGFERVTIASFGRGKLLTSPTQGRALDYIESKLPYRRGFVVPASLFSGCKSDWPVFFGVWSNA